MDNLIKSIASSGMDSEYVIHEINTFLANGGNINDESSSKRTLLCHAIRHYRVSIVKELLKHKDIDVNKVSGDEPPLFTAFSWPNTEIIGALLDHPNIDIHASLPEGYPIVFKAIENDIVDAIQILVKRPDFHVNIEYEGYPLLFDAIKRIRVKIVEVLLTREDLNINFKHSSTGDTPLHMALYFDSVPITKLLLTRKDIDVNPHTQDHYGGATPLHLSTQRGDFELFEILMEHPNIDVNVQDIKGYTPLLAITDIEIISKVQKLNKLLAHPKIEVDCVDHEGQNLAILIVHYLSQQSQQDMRNYVKFVLVYIEKLIEKGMQLLLPDHNGETVVDVIKLLPPKLMVKLDNIVVEYLKKKVSVE
jgi:ankyrin repeat protein